MIKKFIKFGGKNPVWIPFILYTIFILIVIFVVKVILKNPSDFLMLDDGYYTIGKKFYEGKMSLINSGRPLALPLLFSSYNLFPDVVQPFVRLSVTMVFVFININLIYKIFSNISNNEEIFIGLLIALFNPVNIHFTIKSTPEVYITTFFLLVVYWYYKLINYKSWNYFFLIALSIIISIFFKPVLFIIPIFLLIFNFIFKIKKLNLKTSLLIILSIIFLIVNNRISYIEDKQYYNGLSYGALNIIGATFLPRVMFNTGRFSLDAYDDVLQNNPGKSNVEQVRKLFEDWSREYREKNPVFSESNMVMHFIIDNKFEFVLSKILNVFFFTSLASNMAETLMNFGISCLLIIFSFLGLRKKMKVNKELCCLIIFCLIGYFSIHFIAFGYARYSLPFMFLLTPFTGTIIYNFFIKEKAAVENS